MKIKFILLSIILALLSLFALKSKGAEPRYDEILDGINITSLDEAVKDICVVYPQYCSVVVNKIYPLMDKGKYKLYLFYISYIESKFIYRVGIYDKNDVSFFQLNWRNKTVRDFARQYNIYTKNQLIYNTRVAARIALRVLLVNIAIFYKTKGWLPKKSYDLISLYHYPYRVKKSYVRKVGVTIRKFQYTVKLKY